MLKAHSNGEAEVGQVLLSKFYQVDFSTKMFIPIG